ncbi:hypothetical protein Y032_0408g922 [Ancylostoma ceylanicum]|uniref:Uncharacterized protein n=1 Tax=Ancylostoma ceylanicum TaxID=53326 RepID=A0A016X210_9BILA|nr:hypothetical protein Y032_0408g922 [Ancylostoma ceylanicum]
MVGEVEFCTKFNEESNSQYQCCVHAGCLLQNGRILRNFREWCGNDGVLLVAARPSGHYPGDDCVLLQQLITCATSQLLRWRVTSLPQCSRLTASSVVLTDHLQTIRVDDNIRDPHTRNVSNPERFAFDGVVRQNRFEFLVVHGGVPA